VGRLIQNLGQKLFSFNLIEEENKKLP